MNDNYELPDNLIDKIDPYFLSEDNSFSDWNKWSLVSFLEYANERQTLSFNDKRELHRRFGDSISAILKSDAPATVKKVIKNLKNKMCSVSVDLFWLKIKTDEEIAFAEAEYQRRQAFLELKNRFENRVIESREREVEKDVNKALSVLNAPITKSLSDNASIAPPPRYTPTNSPRNAPQPLSQDVSTTTPPSDNASTASSPCYTPTTPLHNAPQPQLQDASTTTPPPGNASTTPLSRYTTPPRNAPPPPSQNILKRSFDIYETSYEMGWAPWNFNITISDVNIESVLTSLHERYQKTKPKTKTSLEYGIIDLNDGIILEALGQSVISHFEAKMQEYKPKKALSVEVMRTLKTFNVTSLEDLGKALDEVKIDYKNLDHDIIYLRRLFEKFFLLFQDKSTINLDNRDLPEGWYNSHIVAPIFDDCLESMDECILRRGEVESFLDKKSRKKKKYDGILSFSRQFEFIYVETETTSVLSKSDKDLSKLHNAIILMFKHM
ncbi:25860_t:CDS:2, partial [Gigaspora rosea]